MFGGQVLGQALKAAHDPSTTAAWCIRCTGTSCPRRLTKPLVYSVDRSRDGGSFSARRVVAVQNGEQLFICSASFQAPEIGLEYQATMPPVPPPEELAPLSKPPQTELDKLPEKLRRWLEIQRPFEFRRCSVTTRWRRWRANPCGRSGCAPRAN